MFLLNTKLFHFTSIGVLLLVFVADREASGADDVNIGKQTFFSPQINDFFLLDTVCSPNIEQSA